jgi:hypothetical protein
MDHPRCRFKRSPLVQAKLSILNPCILLEPFTSKLSQKTYDSISQFISNNMKIHRCALGLTVGALLLSQIATTAMAHSAKILNSSSDSFQTALKQEDPVYVTDRQFTKGEWSFKIIQAGSDLKYQGSSLLRGKDIIVNQVKRTKEKGRLIYTWRTGASTFYVVSWRPSDPTFARLKVIKAGRVVVDNLLSEETPP